MIKAEIPVYELDRLKALQEYQILDTLPESDFDDITRLASAICEVPISVISMVDKDRQWFKSRYGNVADTETPRDIAFCAHAILNPHETLVVSDSSKDERFFDNPLATGGPNIVFYAGVPLMSDDGNAIGVLCAIDNKPKEITPRQLDALKALGNQVMAQMELRKKIKELEASRDELKMANIALDKFAYVVSHDLKAPLNGIMALTDEFKDDYKDKIDDSGMEMVDFIHDRAKYLVKFIQGVLEYSKTPELIACYKEEFEVNSFISELTTILQIPKSFKIIIEADEKLICTSRIALQQILFNLCNNAIKYNEKQLGELTVKFHESDRYYHFSVADNGPGIPKESHQKIFELFTTLGTKDRFNEQGTGIGLSTVKKLVDQMDGTIELVSEPGEGATFKFALKKDMNN
ncbi:MAG: GAF domain-containing sensor histidine kinase [Bacteroidota bacterium]